MEYDATGCIGSSICQNHKLISSAQCRDLMANSQLTQRPIWTQDAAGPETDPDEVSADWQKPCVSKLWSLVSIKLKFVWELAAPCSCRCVNLAVLGLRASCLMRL